MVNGPILIQDHVDLAAATANALFASANSKRQYQASDFMPKWDQSEGARRDRVRAGFEKLLTLAEENGQSPT